MYAYIYVPLLLVPVLIWYFARSTSRISDKRSKIALEDRNFIQSSDLLDATIRSNPRKFNQHLAKITKNSKIATIQKGIIPVKHEENTFLICNYDLIKEILEKNDIFSSNPFKDERLIAPHAMDDPQHKQTLKYLRKFYSTSTITKQMPDIQLIINKITRQFLEQQHTTNEAMSGWCTQIVMQTSLFMMGLPKAIYSNGDIVNTLIKFNDEMVQIIAPLGGIGHKIDFSIKSVFNLIIGLIHATLPTLSLIYNIGIMNAWQLLRPDLNIKVPDNASPRIQLWIYPHILHIVPKYFAYLNDLYVMYGINAESPNNNLQSNIVNGKNVLQSFHAAELNGDMNRADIIVTMVQLMVNMTTANAIGNMLYRISTQNIGLKEYFCDKNGTYDHKKSLCFIEEILRWDAPLQRLPRRCRMDYTFYGQKFPANSTILCMIGYANCVAYQNGWEFIADRHKKNGLRKPLTFGYGMHLCLGYWLVKREMDLAINSLIVNGINNIKYVSSTPVVNVDVGNSGFAQLRLIFH